MERSWRNKKSETWVMRRGVRLTAWRMSLLTKTFTLICSAIDKHFWTNNGAERHKHLHQFAITKLLRQMIYKQITAFGSRYGASWEHQKRLINYENQAEKWKICLFVVTLFFCLIPKTKRKKSKEKTKSKKCFIMMSTQKRDSSEIKWIGKKLSNAPKQRAKATWGLD